MKRLADTKGSSMKINDFYRAEKLIKQHEKLKKITEGFKNNRTNVNVNLSCLDPETVKKIETKAVKKTKEEKNPIIIERINKRILKVESFLNYLREEEKREKEKFSLTDNDILISDIYDNFNIQKIDVLKGAKRNYGEKTTDDNTFKKTKNGFTVLD